MQCAVHRPDSLVARSHVAKEGTQRSHVGIVNSLPAASAVARCDVRPDDGLEVVRARGRDAHRSHLVALSSADRLVHLVGGEVLLQQPRDARACHFAQPVSRETARDEATLSVAVAQRVELGLGDEPLGAEERHRVIEWHRQERRFAARDDRACRAVIVLRKLHLTHHQLAAERRLERRAVEQAS